MVPTHLLEVQGVSVLEPSQELLKLLVVAPNEDCFNLRVRADSSDGEGSCGVIHVTPGHNVTPGLRGDDNIIYTKAYRWWRLKEKLKFGGSL